MVYSCGFCTKCFTRKKNLQRHLWKFHKIVQSVNCKYCDKTSQGPLTSLVIALFSKFKKKYKRIFCLRIGPLSRGDSIVPLYYTTSIINGILTWKNIFFELVLLLCKFAHNWHSIVDKPTYRSILQFRHCLVNCLDGNAYMLHGDNFDIHHNTLKTCTCQLFVFSCNNKSRDPYFSKSHVCWEMSQLGKHGTAPRLSLIHI